MIKHNRLLHKENDTLKEENTRLSHLIHLAQQRIKDLSGTLQKNQINIMPTITVCNDLIETSTSKRNERMSACFASAGQVQLDSPATCLCDGTFIAAGEINGSISLWSASQNIQSRSTTNSLYRFSSTDSSKSIEKSSLTNPLNKASDPLVGHEGPVTSIQWFDANSISSVSLDSTLRIWDISTSQCQTYHISIPSVSHAIVDTSIVAANCTKSIFFVDTREETPTEIVLDSPITSVASTNLGLFMGNSTGALLLYDPRINKVYQELQISAARLPISKISGTNNVTVTSFDGIVRLIGTELPIFVEKEFSRAPINGSIIGSCCVSLANRDDFIICGSTSGKAIVWTSSDAVQTLSHTGNIVYDCVPLNSFVGSFVTCDNANYLTMWARSFDQASV
ncbi:hypothetical protein TRFO_34169 [Tritrichomonas foetus]|uniref:Uncharacterized protein n=1 Tax=Tritrichomonas foetus TaxID=1144522 RepID=A0A1J4JPF3_9EUKA|nr:hypothetical protein TRFO_34169 [Tritrichomonas foetus]|eukprot:OHS99395.1 hypothetical protein TRFO_34169 [Tritrichomonas foetus]